MIAVLTLVPLSVIEPADKAVLTVELPIRTNVEDRDTVLPASVTNTLVVFILTLAPTLTTVATLTVAGSLAVAKVPVVRFVALDAIVMAFE